MGHRAQQLLVLLGGLLSPGAWLCPMAHTPGWLQGPDSSTSSGQGCLGDTHSVLLNFSNSQDCFHSEFD